MDFDNNVKIQHQEIKCAKVAIAVSGNTVTFPNIQKTGDCMGDALRGQKKDVTKFSIGINSDGTLTFHSTWPDLKLKKASELEAALAANIYATVMCANDKTHNYSFSLLETAAAGVEQTPVPDGEQPLLDYASDQQHHHLSREREPSV